MTDIDQLRGDLDRAKEEIAGPVPVIEPSPDCMVTLPRGLIHNAQPQTRAEVRELTGNDEEFLARYKKPEEIFDAVLAVGTVRIGELDLEPLPVGERQAHLRQLLIGERDALFLAIARTTYGDTRRFPVKCSVCGREQELGISLTDDFQPRVVEDIGSRSFKFTTSKGQEIEYRLANGADQLAVLKKDGMSLAEMNTTMISACVLAVNGQVVVDPLNYARSLPIRDRQTLMNEMLDRQPSIDLTIKYPCFGCQEEQRTSFVWLDFFRL